MKSGSIHSTRFQDELLNFSRALLEENSARGMISPRFTLSPPLSCCLLPPWISSFTLPHRVPGGALLVVQGKILLSRRDIVTTWHATRAEHRSSSFRKGATFLTHQAHSVRQARSSLAATNTRHLLSFR